MRALSAGPRRRLPRPILVTGGAGFIGSHTVEALLRAGYRVRVLDDLSSGHRRHLPMLHPQLEFCLGSILDARRVSDCMEGAGGCIHLAAQVSTLQSIAAPADSAQRNVIGFIHVLEAVRRHRVPRLVYASSAAVYGEPRRLPLTETAAPEPRSPYGLEKWADEQYAALYGRLHGLHALGLRYFNVYGPRQDPRSPYSGVISRFLERIAAETPPCIRGDGRQSRDFIHVRDVAEANVAALASALDGVCNVATGRRTSLLELVRLLGRTFHTRLSPQFQPALAGDIRHSCGDVRRLRRKLGVVPRWRLEDGLLELRDTLGLAPAAPLPTFAASPPPPAAAGRAA